MGFGYTRLRELNPRIILASGSIFGQSGPMSSYPGVDATGAARAGRISASGYPNGRSLLPGLTYGDSVLPFFLAAGVMGALDRRERTGRGCWIDGSMQEVLVQQMWPMIQDYAAGNHHHWRTGNRHPATAPHNIYPTLGDDRWLAIEVWSGTEWQALCRVMNKPELAQDPRFADNASRKTHENALDELIGEWTQAQDGESLMMTLQEHDVAAGVVRNTSELVDHDPQLRHREFLQPLDQPMLGRFGHQRTPISLQKGAQRIRVAPALGEHTAQVCREILGMTEEQIAQLQQDGVLGKPTGSLM